MVTSPDREPPRGPAALPVGGVRRAATALLVGLACVAGCGPPKLVPAPTPPPSPAVPEEPPAAPHPSPAPAEIPPAPGPPSPSDPPSPADTPPAPPASPGDDTSVHPGLGAYVRFPAVGVRLRAPAGYVQAEAFHGFGQEETASSVVAVRVPGPYAEVTKGFTAEHMAPRGWALVSRDETQVGGRPALVVRFRQPAAGTVFVKCLLAFGDEKSTTLVTATSPEAEGDEHAALLERVVLSARTEEGDPAAAPDDLPFTIEPSSKLLRTPPMGRTAAFTKDGVLRKARPEDPLFVAALSLGGVGPGGVPLPDRRRYAEDRIRRTASTEAVEVRSSEPVSIDGLDGFETLADARHAGSDVALLLHQVLLFDGEGYVLMQGLVGADLSEEYLPEFRAMARSFRRAKR